MVVFAVVRSVREPLSMKTGSAEDGRGLTTRCEESCPQAQEIIHSSKLCKLSRNILFPQYVQLRICGNLRLIPAHLGANAFFPFVPLI